MVPQDSARWGAIWAGLIATLATFVLLELLAFGAFVSLLVAALVSALGGFLGGRTDKPIGRVSDSGDQRG